jgi:hypothetical protein
MNGNGNKKMLKRGDQGFVVSPSNKNNKIAVTFRHRIPNTDANNGNHGISCFLRSLSIPVVARSEMFSHGHFLPHQDASLMSNFDLFTFEGHGPISERRVHKPGDIIIFACTHKEKVFAFQEASVVAYDKDREYLVRIGTSYEDTELHLVPYNCIYLANWKHLHTRCRKAIVAWCLCAKRIGLVRDVIQLIAHRIWDLRDEREWE